MFDVTMSFSVNGELSASETSKQMAEAMANAPELVKVQFRHSTFTSSHFTLAQLREFEEFERWYAQRQKSK